jgi:hypothetical protein
MMIFLVEIIKELPEVENIDDIQEDIFVTESDLLEITSE